MSGAAAIGAVGSLVGGYLNYRAAQNAGQLQAGAADRSADLVQGNIAQTREDLAPYYSFGTQALPGFQDLTGTYLGGNPLTAPLTRPFNPTDLESTPGYTFTRDQGLAAAQNRLTASGLGKSGNAVKAAADYAGNLASTTYNQQLSNDMAQRNQLYQMLQGIVGSGQNAAAQQGGFSTTGTGQTASLITGGAGAQAAGSVGAAQAISNGLGGVTDNALLARFLGSR